KLGGKRPEINLVLVAEDLGAETVLLVMVRPAEAHPENIMRPLTRAGIRSRAQMGKIDRACVTTRDAAAMRFDPAPMSRPDLLQGCAHPQLWPLPSIGQLQERFSSRNGRSELIG